MSRGQIDDFWAAWHRCKAQREDRPDVRQAVFREHFCGADEGDTAGYAKSAVAALLGEMRLRSTAPEGEEGCAR